MENKVEVWLKSYPLIPVPKAHTHLVLVTFIEFVFEEIVCLLKLTTLPYYDWIHSLKFLRAQVVTAIRIGCSSCLSASQTIWLAASLPS